MFVDVVGNTEHIDNKDDALKINGGEVVQHSVSGKVNLTQTMIDEINQNTETAGINFVGVIRYFCRVFPTYGLCLCYNGHGLGK